MPSFEAWCLTSALINYGDWVCFDSGKERRSDLIEIQTSLNLLRAGINAGALKPVLPLVSSQVLLILCSFGDCVLRGFSSIARLNRCFCLGNDGVLDAVIIGAAEIAVVAIQCVVGRVVALESCSGQAVLEAVAADDPMAVLATGVLVGDFSHPPAVAEPALAQPLAAPVPCPASIRCRSADSAPGPPAEASAVRSVAEGLGAAWACSRTVATLAQALRLSTVS